MPFLWHRNLDRWSGIAICLFATNSHGTNNIDICCRKNNNVLETCFCSMSRLKVRLILRNSTYFLLPIFLLVSLCSFIGAWEISATFLFKFAHWKLNHLQPTVQLVRMNYNCLHSFINFHWFACILNMLGVQFGRHAFTLCHSAANCQFALCVFWVFVPHL